MASTTSFVVGTGRATRARRACLLGALAAIAVAGAASAPAQAGVRVAYTAACTNQLGCGGFAVLVMDEQGRSTRMVQDCFSVCDGEIPSASVTYGPRIAGQHAGAFSDDDPASGRRFAVGLMATGLDEPVSFTFRLVDPDGAERTVPMTLAPDVRPIVTQCGPVGSTPAGLPLTVLASAGGCAFGAPVVPSPAAVDPLAGVVRFPTTTSRALTTYLPAGFVAQSVAEGAGGRIWITAGNTSAALAPFRAFAGTVGATGELRIVVDSSPDNAAVPDAFVQRTADGSVTGPVRPTVAAPAASLIRMTPAGQVTRSPLAPGVALASAGSGAPVAVFAGRGQELWGVDTKGPGGWTLMRLHGDGTVARRYRTGVTGQLDGLVIGPDRAVWMGDGFGRMWRLTPGGRVVRAAVPKDIYRLVLQRGPDGATYFVDFLPRPRIGRIGRNLKVSRSCQLPLKSSVDRLAATARGVWFMPARSPGDLHLLRPTGELVRYRRAVPGATRVRAMAPGANGSLLLAYTSGPRSSTHPVGHVARFTPPARGQRVCRTWSSAGAP